MDYVLGFQFDVYGSKVALVRKKRPKWQAGLLNGIGGHVEPSELPGDAMLREFAEETGVPQEDVPWKHYARLNTWTGHRVFCYCSFTDKVEKVETVTDECIHICSTCAFARVELVPSALWMIEMALSMKDGRFDGDGRTPSGLLVVNETPPIELS